MLSNVKECIAYIRSKTDFIPETAIILGTGLGALVHEVQVESIFDYKELPHFPVSTVETHAGKLILGYLEGKPVVIMQGRFHYYEGYTMQQVVFPVRVVKLLGAQRLFVSNVSGGLNPAYEAGDLVVIKDHINLQPDNPLRGPNEEAYGVRFPDMMEPYHPILSDFAFEYAQQQKYRAHQGVYVSVPGPNLETRAEYKYLRLIGADLVGMSTVPEVIAAVHLHMKVLGISIITDLCYEPKLKKADIHEIIAVAAQAEPRLCDVFRHVLKEIG